MPSFNFDTDTQGWSTVGGANLSHEPTGGSSGGYIRGVDAQNGVDWYFDAPVQLLGDLTSYLGGTIAFDLIQEYSDAQFDADDLIIAGNGITLVASFANPATTWTSYLFDLEVGTFRIGSETGRIASQAEVLQVLANVDRFEIRGEFRSGPDAAGLDNFVFAEGEAAPPPQPSEFVESTFETGRDGWTFIADVAEFRQVATGGAPGGYLEAVDAATGQLWYFVAPGKFLGDKALFVGGTISFDLRQSDVSSQTEPEAADIIIGGAGLTLCADLPGNPGTDWTRYSLSLDSMTAWRLGSTSGPLATEAQIASVLGALDYIHVRGEYRNGADTGGLDNFRMEVPDNVRIGSDAGETLTGTEAGDLMAGRGGNDVISGLNGDDLLIGGEGDDNLDGGDGSDTASYADASSGVTVRLDRAVQAASGAGRDTLSNIENLIGSAHADLLIGNSLANLLDGGAGADTMQGGNGNDRYVVDNVGDKIIEANGQGGDTVDASVTFTLAGQYLEALNLTGTAAINGSGNSLDNRIIGNSAANTLNGAAGNDRLDGGAGADKLIGGIGNDAYVVDNAGDVIVENNGEGTDTVEASISYSIAGQYIETLKLTGSANINATGNGQANTLTGNSGNNVLNGGGAVDTMAGGAGNDRYIVDNALDKVTELTGEGIDTVEASVSFSIAGQHIEELRLTGTAAIDGSGNSLANSMWGNGAANKLNGSTGDDALHGGLGSDTLTGGAGADHFWFETTLGANNVDGLSDFKAAEDMIHLDRSIFTGIATEGPLSSDAFYQGTAAHDSDDRIIYNKATGQILYDSDGDGAAAAVLFATVAANTVVAFANFFVDA